MVEAPRILITYEKIKFTKGKIIISASGATYRKIGIDIIGYTIKKWWFAGKYIYCDIQHNVGPEYVIRTHMMMFGKIIVNDEVKVNPKLIPFLILELDDGTKLTWYLSQIKFIDPNCTADISSNYGTCSSLKHINNSIKLMTYDASNENYHRIKHLNYVMKAKQKSPDDIITDLLLNQKYFPGVGNILQQEILYRCKIAPKRKLSKIKTNDMICLINELGDLIKVLYLSYINKQLNIVYRPILQIYHKSYCPLNHKTKTKIIGYHERRTTWCPICQV